MHDANRVAATELGRIVRTRSANHKHYTITCINVACLQIFEETKTKISIK